MAQPNEDLMRCGYEAFANGDIGTLTHPEDGQPRSMSIHPSGQLGAAGSGGS